MEEIKKMNIYEKLLKVQIELKAPKGQYNSFGKYKYRSCEDILESVKPVLGKYRLTLKVSDELVYLGERYYVKATAMLIDLDSQEDIANTAYAREEEIKKGMDGSQITGTASSYARKYALNGLFCIDDTKDADTDEYANQNDTTEKVVKAATDKQKEMIKGLYEEEEIKQELIKLNKPKLSELTIQEASELISKKKEGKNYGSEK